MLPFVPETARFTSRRLARLLRREPEGLADFLVALGAFDRQEQWRELGHRSLVSYLHHELRLPHSAAHHRKVAAELIQQVPEVLPALRDGRLRLSAVGDLARVVTRENQERELPRFLEPPPILQAQADLEARLVLGNDWVDAHARRAG